MVKNNWSNPELKQLSIENTLETVWVCSLCNTEYNSTTKPNQCNSRILVQDPEDGQYHPCWSTEFYPINNDLGDPS